MTGKPSHECAYVAKKDEPGTWHNEDPNLWGLDRDTWSCPHESLNHRGIQDSEYCVFHTDPAKLPDDIDEAEELIDAVEDSNKGGESESREKQREFIGAIFGSFKLTPGTELKPGENQIKFDHSVFRRGLTSNSVRWENVSFRNVSFFGGNVSFERARFEGDGDVSFRKINAADGCNVWFTKSRFIGSGSVSFSESRIVGEGEVSFRDAKFDRDGPVAFRDVKCTGEASFKNCWIESGTVTFQSSDFSKCGGVDFDGVYFSGEDGIWFRDSTFTCEGDVSFVNSVFWSGENISFLKTDFGQKGNVTFEGAEFHTGGSILFSGSNFTERGEVSFRDAVVEAQSNLDFCGVELSEGTTVTFRDAVLKSNSNLRFDQIEFDCSATFNGARFGGQGELTFWSSKFAEDEHLSFNDVEFRTDVSFEEAKLESETTFESAEFDGELNFDVEALPDELSFRAAKLIDCELTIPSLRGADLRRADFTNTSLRSTNLRGANLEQAILSRCDLYGADLTATKIDGAIFAESQVNQETDFGEKVDYRVPYDPNYKRPDDPTVEHPYRRLKRKIVRYLPRRPTWRIESGVGRSEIAGYDLDEVARGELLIKASRSYHTLERIGRENAFPRLQTRSFVRRQEMNRLRYAEEISTSGTSSWRTWTKWTKASAARLALLYGESPWRIIAASLFVILISGMLYPLGGFRPSTPGTSTVPEVRSLSHWLSLVPDGIYFSTLTFTSLGFGDYQPVGWGRTLAVFETAIGATLLALLVFVLGRRAAR